ncbi:MAG: hypothetical protein IKQ46_01325 [Bacteroidales bacterium]|nr:hypothetical protein [Bacteroidales bacterium]
MKKNILLIPMLCMVMGFMACTKDDSYDDAIDIQVEKSPEYNITFAACFETPQYVGEYGESTLQKMNFVDGSFTKITFEPKDRFALWGISGEQSMAVNNATENTEDVTLSAAVFPEEKEGEFFALYPLSSATSISDNVITAAIPTTQHVKKNHFDSDAFIATAYSAKGARQFSFKTAISSIKIRIPSGVRYKTIKIISAETPIAGNIAITVSRTDGTITNVENLGTAKEITLECANANDYFEDGIYFACVAPGVINGGFYVTLIAENGDISTRKVSGNPECKINKAYGVAIEKYIEGTNLWYKVVRDGQVGIDLGMVVDGYRIYWTPYNYGGTSYTDQGELYGWGQQLGNCGETYVPLTSMNDFYYPSNNGWKPALTSEFSELLSGSIVDGSDVWEVTYNNRTLKLAKEINVKAQEIESVSGTKLIKACSGYYNSQEIRDIYREIFEEIIAEGDITEDDINSSTTYELLYMLYPGDINDNGLKVLIQEKNGVVPEEHVDKKVTLKYTYYLCGNGDEIDNQLYANMVRIKGTSKSDVTFFNSKSNNLLYNRVEVLKTNDDFKNFNGYSLALPYRMVYREPVVTLE